MTCLCSQKPETLTRLHLCFAASSAVAWVRAVENEEGAAVVAVAVDATVEEAEVPAENVEALAALPGDAAEREAGFAEMVVCSGEDFVARVVGSAEIEADFVGKEDGSTGKEADSAGNEVGFAEIEVDFAESEADFAETEADFAETEVDLVEKEADFAGKEADFVEKEADFEMQVVAPGNLPGLPVQENLDHSLQTV